MNNNLKLCVLLLDTNDKLWKIVSLGFKKEIPMARAMNVEKRIEALRAIQAKIEGYASKASGIAQDLVNAFDGDKTAEGKRVLKIAKKAHKFSGALLRATGSVGFCDQ
jgi:hypothetical protein